jgi:uridine phosphorylase
MELSYPILEFDPTKRAMIEPPRPNKPDMPIYAVACFFQDVIKKLVNDHSARMVASVASEIGVNPIYEIELNGKRLIVFHPGVGAPLAVGFLEEVIGLGCQKFVVCGGAGVLNSEIAVGHVIVPNAAVRDEGTSYHYLPPAREVAANPADVAVLTRVLEEHNCPYIVGKTWTTDGFYRETPDKVKRRREEGCLVVEMEASAFFAVAQFREVQLVQLLYGGDDLGSEQWDSRDWTTATSAREKLFWLAAEACLAL